MGAAWPVRVRRPRLRDAPSGVSVIPRLCINGKCPTLLWECIVTNVMHDIVLPCLGSFDQYLYSRRPRCVRLVLVVRMPDIAAPTVIVVVRKALANSDQLVGLRKTTSFCSGFLSIDQPSRVKRSCVRYN